MTPTVFHERLTTIGWSQRALASRLRIHETRVRRWASGVLPIPIAVEDWLNALAQAHEARRDPIGWEDGRAKARAPSCIHQESPG